MVEMEDGSTASGMLSRLAASLGASEPALRLLISILVGYPLAILHRYTLYGKSPTAQHFFFTVCGLSLGYFNYGFDVLHSVFCVVSMYAILKLIGGSSLSVAFSFIFYMTYLLAGYYYTGTENYDIKWSMPHCVLTLRLIGLSFDVFDGRKDPTKLSADQKKTALSEKPSLLEIAGHTYFFGGFMVGPQFPMKRYQDFIKGIFTDKKKPECILPGLLRGSMGVLYLLIFQVSSIFIPDFYIASEHFQTLPYYLKLLALGVWGKVILYKYIACWLLAEGACILTGLTYNGKDENGNDVWDGCANVKISKFEGCTTFGEIIQSFNINTNLWMANYIFKRLKFLGNRMLSQVGTLLFLAVWHGFHSGYYVCFILEFMVMKLERDILNLLNYLPTVSRILDSPTIKPIKWFVLKVYVIVFMGYCLIPFVFLAYDRWWMGYKSVYFIGHILYVGWFFASIGIMPLFKPPKPEKFE